MRAKKIIGINPCQENWENMSGNERQRLCEICKKKVTNVTDLDLDVISDEFVNTEKCVKMSSDQVVYFQFFRSMSKVAGLTAALTFLPISEANAQGQKQQTKYCLVTGKVKSNIVAFRTIFVVVNGRKIETRSNNDGTFQLMIPKGEKIQHSNIRKLNNKSFKEDNVDVNKVRMPKQSIFIGTPSF